MADPLEISIENPCSASKKPISFSISDAWAYHKKEIVKLYISENRKLSELRQYMEERHGFRAT